MILFAEQKPVYLTLMTDALYGRYEAQFDCDTTWQTEACKEEFTNYLQNNPDAATQVFLGWEADFEYGESYRKLYRQWQDPFSISYDEEDGNSWMLDEFLLDASKVFKSFNAKALKKVLLKYTGRLVSLPHPSQILS